MASAYSPNLNIELIGTGDQAGSWGDTTNYNWGEIEEAVSGYVNVAVTTGNTTTITIPNGPSTAPYAIARNMYLVLTGTGGANTYLEVPANKKLYYIYNSTAGAVTVRITGTATGTSILAGTRYNLICTGVDIVPATTLLLSLASGTLAVANGGTGVTTFTAGQYLKGNGTSAITTSATIPNTDITGLGTMSTQAASSVAITGGTISGTTVSTTRINPRVSSTASASSVTPDIASYDVYAFTALASGLTINAPTGTPVDGNKLLFRILDNGSSRTLTWNATYVALGVVIPTVTPTSKTIYVGCIYNASLTRWDVIAVTTD